MVTEKMDYTVSSLPIRVIDVKVDKSILKVTNLRIISFGHLPGRKSRRRNVRFDHWALAYIRQGVGTYQVDGQPMQQVKGGSIFFIFPGASFTYGPAKHKVWEEYYISFEGLRAEEWDRHQFIYKDRVMEVGTDQFWVQKIETIAAQLETGVPANSDRAALLLESLLYELSLMYDQKEGLGKGEKITHMLDFLSHHIYEPIDVAALANKLNVSISTLRRMIRLHTGYPLNEYLHRLKISEAKKLLMNSDSSVKEIALSLGYTDVYYFSRIFKKYTGTSPKIFRYTF